MKKEILLALTAGIVTVLVSDLKATPGDLYVGNGGNILKFAPNGTKKTFATGLAHPVDLAFSHCGNLFVSDNAAAKILEFDRAANPTVFTSEVPDLFGIAFDAAGNLYVGSGQDNAIFKITPRGAKTEFVSGLRLPGGIAFDNAGDLYEADTGSGRILKFSRTGTRSVFASDLRGPYDLAFDRAGNLYAADGLNGIVKFTPSGVRSTFVSGFTPVGLAFDEYGNLFAVDVVAASIFKVSPAGVKTTFASGLYSISFFLAFEPSTDKLRNISVRAAVQPGDGALIAGFIAGGSALRNNEVIIRGLGPSLASAGVSAPLPDPILELHDASGAVVASNNDWQDSQAEQIVATGLAPTDPKETAIYAVLPAGAYTAVLRGGNNSAGIALAEVYALH